MSLRDKHVSKFQKRLDLLTSHHKELKIALYGKKHESSLYSELVVQLTLQSVVLWESFLSDLVLTYVEMDPHKALSGLHARIQQSILDKFGKTCANCTQFAEPRGRNRKTLTALLDGKGWNITARSASELSSLANNHLVSTYARQFALDPAESEFFDYVVALRNYLSHQSTGSRVIVKTALTQLTDPQNQCLKGPITPIGTYLKSPLATGPSKAEFIVTRLRALAGKL